jgi:CHASE2 domain-containing sensor protein
MLPTDSPEPSPLAWAVLYLVLRTAWAVALARVTVREGATAAWVWSAAAADACASVLVLAWWHPTMRPMLGALVLPLFLYPGATRLRNVASAPGENVEFEVSARPGLPH